MRDPRIFSCDHLTNVVVNLIVINVVWIVVGLAVAAGVVVVLVLLDLSLLRNVVGVGRWRRLFNSGNIN